MEPTTKPWYQSRSFLGIGVAVLSQALALSPLAAVVAPDDVAKVVDLGMQAVSMGAGIYAGWRRVKQKAQPLTLTKQP